MNLSSRAHTTLFEFFIKNRKIIIGKYCDLPSCQECEEKTPKYELKAKYDATSSS